LIQVVRKAFAVLECFRTADGSLSYKEICARLDLPRTTVHRLLTDLAEQGYVTQDPETGEYALGIKLFEIGMRAVAQRGLVQTARPIMEELGRVSGETVNLGVLSVDYQVVYIDKYDSRNALKMDRPIGAREDAYSTALGKVLLAHLPPSDLEAYLSRVHLVQHGPNTITSVERLRECLGAVEAEGIAFDDRESHPGLACIAAPIRGNRGKVLAALSISGPASRFSGECFAEWSEPLREGCMRISTSLGYTGA